MMPADHWSEGEPVALHEPDLVGALPLQARLEQASVSLHYRES